MFEAELAQLKNRYGLAEWNIYVKVVPSAQLEPQNAAEVQIREPYRSATIYLSKELVADSQHPFLVDVLEHEVQHIFLHPLEAMKELALDAAHPEARALIEREFVRAGERVRASVERLLSKN